MRITADKDVDHQQEMMREWPVWESPTAAKSTLE